MHLGIFLFKLHAFLLKRNTDFDIERMRAAAKQMEGYHDFRSFMKASKEQKTVRIPQ